jgi:hypothetical protein
MSYIKKNISMRNINKNKICENDFWNDCVDFDNIQSNFNNYNKFINNNNNKKILLINLIVIFQLLL